MRDPALYVLDAIFASALPTNVPGGSGKSAVERFSPFTFHFSRLASAAGDVRHIAVLYQPAARFLFARDGSRVRFNHA